MQSLDQWHVNMTSVQCLPKGN
uniref:Uncharacterized protein n=1 Tax=Arundo donax TaxID=35708 RepID=A0A0A9GQF9_ARUDO